MIHIKGHIIYIFQIKSEIHILVAFPFETGGFSTYEMLASKYSSWAANSSTCGEGVALEFLAV